MYDNSNSWSINWLFLYKIVILVKPSSNGGYDNWKPVQKSQCFPLVLIKVHDTTKALLETDNHGLIKNYTKGIKMDAKSLPSILTVAPACNIVPRSVIVLEKHSHTHTHNRLTLKEKVNPCTHTL